MSKDSKEKYMERAINLRTIHEDFDCKVIGDPNRIISSCSTIEYQDEEVLMWAVDAPHLKHVFKGVVVSYEKFIGSIRPGVGAILFKDHLRYNFARVLHRYFNRPYKSRNLVYGHLNGDYQIGDHVFIGEDVIIGEGTIIEPNVVIHKNTIIGKNCRIQCGATISTKGLGYERDKDGNWFEFPQLGGVLIEDQVEIGPNTTVRRAALGFTLIRRGAIIGGLVNIGHNSDIGSNSLIVTGAIVGGSSVIGKDAYVGMNVAIRNKIFVGEGAIIGMGSVVTKDVPTGMTVMGNPAKERR